MYFPDNVSLCTLRKQKLRICSKAQEPSGLAGFKLLPGSGKRVGLGKAMSSERQAEGKELYFVTCAIINTFRRAVGSNFQSTNLFMDLQKYLVFDLFCRIYLADVCVTLL